MKARIEDILTFISEQAGTYATRAMRTEVQYKATLAQRDKELTEAAARYKELHIKYDKLYKEYESLKEADEKLPLKGV